MNRKTRILEFTDKRIEEGETVLSTKWIQSGNWISASGPPQYVDLEQFKKWSASCKLLITLMGDIGNPWKELFDGNSNNGLAIAQSMQGTLKAIREAIADDFVQFEDLKVSQQNQESAVIEKKEDSRIFIGHGGSPLWRELKDFLSDRLGLPWDEFNREAVAGIHTFDLISEMLDSACFAFLIMTAEDQYSDSSTHARQNVVHEVGLFQGRLGPRKAIILLEDGCSEFSNILGLSQIPFPKGQISAVFEEVRRVLEREGVIKT